MLTKRKYKRDPERDALIAQRYRNEETLQAIGDSYGLTRERVRQIVKREGLTRADGGRFLRSSSRRAARVARVRGVYVESFGCTRGEARDLNEGKRMGAADSLARAYLQQRHHALWRGIPWALTFPQWVALWKATGHFDQRGRAKDSYVMTRWDFAQGFHIGNVCICTMSEATTASLLQRQAREAGA
jgi:hypothetical protein